MATDRDLIDSLETLESDRFQQLMADERFKDNPLLPEFQQLHNLYRTLAQRSERMVKEKEYLQTQLDRKSGV